MSIITDLRNAYAMEVSIGIAGGNQPDKQPGGAGGNYGAGRVCAGAAREI